MPQHPGGSFAYTVCPRDTLRLIAQRFHTTIYSIATMNPEIYLNPIYVGQVIYLTPEKEYRPISNFKSMDENIKTMEKLKEEFRSLWEQHVEWTRFVIASIVFGLPNLEAVTNRLLKNPKDFENMFLPYYGSEKSSKLTELLTNHLAIAAQLVKAAKAGNRDLTSKTEKNWYSNADEIAAFLGSINPYWPVDDWKSMLYKHLALTTDEAVNMLNKKYPEDVSTYDEIEKEALAMADMMENGVIRQFPNKFTN